MALPIVWSSVAIADRDAVFDYIAADSSNAAARIDERILNRTDLLVDFPKIGRSGRLPGTRELVIPGTPYLIVYRVTPELILILRILHGAQHWP